MIKVKTKIDFSFRKTIDFYGS